MKSAILFMLLMVLPAAAQAPPTATEAFNLRIRCKEMAAEKLESLQSRPLGIADGASLGMSPATVQSLNKYVPEVVHSHFSSKYDAANNRCYVEVYIHTRTKQFDVEHRQIYDAQVDDLLAFAKIENGKKVGMVFDHQHQKTSDTNLGWDDANAYIDQMMADKRR
jgi:acyl-CoA hydrolase